MQVPHQNPTLMPIVSEDGGLADPGMMHEDVIDGGRDQMDEIARGLATGIHTYSRNTSKR